MPFKSQCPAGHALFVPTRFAGKSIKCPKCGAEFTVVAPASTGEAAIERPQPPVEPARKSIAAAPTVAIKNKTSAEKKSPAVKQPSLPTNAKEEAPPLPSPKTKPESPQKTTPKRPSEDVPPPISDPPPNPPPFDTARAKEIAPSPPPVDTAEPALGASPPEEKIAALPTAPVPDVPTTSAPPPVMANTATESPSATSDQPAAATAPPAEATAPPPDSSPPLDAAAAEPKPSTLPPRLPEKPRPSLIAMVQKKGRDIVAAGIIFDEKISRGVEPRTPQLHAVYLFGSTLLALALFSMVPTVLDILGHLRTGKSVNLATWGYGLLFVGGLQGIYAVYTLQMPDWSTTWISTCFTLAIAMLYATIFGALLMGNEASWLVQFLAVQDRLKDARLWSLCILCLTSIAAYFGGRLSTRWRQLHLQEEIS